MALVVKNPPASAEDVRDKGSIPGSGKSPGGGHGNPLQYFCLVNPLDRGTGRLQSMGFAESDRTERPGRAEREDSEERTMQCRWAFPYIPLHSVCDSS